MDIEAGVGRNGKNAERNEESRLAMAEDHFIHYSEMSQIILWNICTDLPKKLFGASLSD